MLRNLSIKAKRLFTLVVLTSAALLIGVSGFFGLQSTNASIKTVYEDRLVCIGQLGDVTALVLVLVLVLQHQILAALSL